MNKHKVIIIHKNSVNPYQAILISNKISTNTKAYNRIYRKSIICTIVQITFYNVKSKN